MIALLDVDYRKDKARAACVVLGAWRDSIPRATFIADVDEVLPYEPGCFYRRELPCLLAVLRLVPQLPTTIVIDGYVWLSSEKRPGLGAHLHEALGGQVPVVGVAKTEFRGMRGSGIVEPVYRGQSKTPLFVTSVGMDTREAAESIRGMHGEHRIPAMLRMTDRLARSDSPSASAP